jgi:hypothetical protein
VLGEPQSHVLAHLSRYSKPADDAPSTVMLSKTDELIFMGKEQEGYANVETSKGPGWVKKVLISK